MRILIPFLSLFLASCASYHTHHNDGAYDDERYYANDYDSYYGYGGQSAGYSGDGSGVYFNNYNYYPDRWGNNYSSINYSPYRYPRIGFYYSDCFSWTWGCYGYGSFNTWSSWSPWFYGGIAYSSWHYDDYYWYNRWRHRTYNHHRPGYGERYSARREVSRLADRSRNNRYKSRPPNRGVKPTQSNRNRVSRERSRYNVPSRKPVRSRSTRPVQQRSKQPQAHNNRDNYNQYNMRQQRTHNTTGSRNELRNQSRAQAGNLNRNSRQSNWVARDLNVINRNKPQGEVSKPNSSSLRYQRNQTSATALQQTRSQEDGARSAQYSRSNRLDKPIQYKGQNNRTLYKPSPTKPQRSGVSKSVKREKSSENRSKSSKSKATRSKTTRNNSTRGNSPRNKR